MGKKLIITIDGPAGVGKSTAASKLARTLGLIHLNSGALFRATGLAAFEQGIPLDLLSAREEELGREDLNRRAQVEAEVAAVASRLRFEFVVDERGETYLLVNGQRRDDEIRSPEASLLSSKIALLPLVREELLRVQREVGATSSLVVEGRDTGTVVFWDAPMKFFLDASPEVRARRRAKELGQEATEENIQKILRDAAERDNRDMQRRVAPLRASEDAVRIDTSLLSQEEVVQKMLDILASRQLIRPTSC